MQLTIQQETAMAMIGDFISGKDEQIFILKGYAGTGKTYLVRCLADYLLSRNILPEIMAPTGRAAKVLNGVLPRNVEASTIHRRIYAFEGGGYVTEKGEFRKLLFPLKKNNNIGIYIIDEASMVSSKASVSEVFEFGTGVLIDDLLTYARPHHGGKIIFVGDPAQLPPVGDNRSAALDEAFFREKGLGVVSFTLTDIIRQGKDSFVLKNATMLRTLLEKGERNTLVFEKKDGEVQDIEPSDVSKTYIANPDNSAIVCFSNRQAAQYNKAIRNILFPGEQYICAGDKLMVVRNSYRENRILLNGDMITVLAVHGETITQSAPVHTEAGGTRRQETVSLTYRKILCRTSDGSEFYTYIIESLLESNHPFLTPDEYKSVFINLRIRAEERGIKKRDIEAFNNFMRDDAFYNALQVKYGYAFTCHKAQGSEWSNVIVDFDKRTGLDIDSLRWKYTAVTRAKKSLFCVNLPDIRPLHGLKIRAIARAKGISPSMMVFDETRKSPFHGCNADPALVSKYWSVEENMQDDGAQYVVRSVQSCPYREIYRVKTPCGEVVRVDALYNKAGLFTRYDIPDNDATLRRYFEDEANIRYKIEYNPENESLSMLKSKMMSLCEEIGITILSIESANWQTAYFLRTSDCNSVVRFYYNAKGEITSAEPLSEKGDADAKLNQLVERIKTQQQLCR